MNVLGKFALLGILSIPVAASALTLTESATAPANSVISQPLFNTVFGNGNDNGGSQNLDGGKDYSDNNGTPGQTFTTGAGALTLNSITIKGANSGGDLTPNGGRYWILSISVFTGTGSGTLTRVTQEASQQFAPGSLSSYLTFALTTPVVLSANSVYEYDIFTTDNGAAPYTSSNGGYYGFAKSATDVYAGGIAMSNGTASRFSANPGSVQSPQTGSDRTFFISGSVVAVPEPSAIAFGIALGATALFGIRRRLWSVS